MSIKTFVISDFVPAALIAQADQAMLTKVAVDLASAARAKWIQLAQQRLHSSRRDYVAGITQVEIDGNEVSVSLVGVLPNLVEQGQSAYDMHTTLLGPSVPVVPVGSGLKGKHQRKDGGYWRVIPFRHQTPGTIGQGGGTPMGNPYEGAVADAKALGRKVYAEAKKLAGTTSKPGGGTSWGDALPEGLAPKLAPHHTTDIYAGMVRMEKTYENATQSTYMTFRIISDGVPDKWQHPGIQAANLADDVHAYLEQIAPAAIAALFQ